MSKARKAVAEDYRDREGYQPRLPRQEFAVPLPEVERDADDVLEFERRRRTETELRYEHYSVVMSRSRRMCFFSAVNIDGNRLEEEHARRLEMGPAHSEGAADHE